jgi:hypothetical protein
MKSVKLNQTLLKDAIKLLRKCGAIIGSQTYPSAVTMNDQDYKVLTKNVKRALKKEYPFLNERRLETSVGMHLLNFGPKTSNAIKRGFALVDPSQITEES